MCIGTPLTFVVRVVRSLEVESLALHLVVCARKESWNASGRLQHCESAKRTAMHDQVECRVETRWNGHSVLALQACWKVYTGHSVGMREHLLVYVVYATIADCLLLSISNRHRVEYSVLFIVAVVASNAAVARTSVVGCLVSRPPWAYLEHTNAKGPVQLTLMGMVRS